VLILIDYPGFNLRIAKIAKEANIKVHYYISPKVWAWKEGRVKKIKQFVDEMYIILPFEKDFYKKHQYQVKYVGNPLLDAVSDFKKKENTRDSIAKITELQNGKKIIALLPGSRKMEVEKILPHMIEASAKFSEVNFIIAGVTTLPESLYKKINTHNYPIVMDSTYDLLSASHAALVASGTATLETALFNVPQVVCYKANPISMRIAKILVNLKFVSLVNLIMDEEIVKELIQRDLNTSLIFKELQSIIEGPKREEMLAKYATLQKEMGEPGASARVAKYIVDEIKE